MARATASFSPKISVEVIGSNAGGGPNGRARSPTIAFSGAVKTLMFSGGDMLIGSSLSRRAAASVASTKATVPSEAAPQTGEAYPAV
jgi:hypothetical protein